MEEIIQDPALSAAISLARLAAETRCGNVVLLDVRQRSPVTKFFLIATGTSARQMRTVADELCQAGEALGFKPWRTSGYESAKWILVDFVDVVLHVFDEASRQYYDLELLWGDCPKIQWRDPNQPELPIAELPPQNDMTEGSLVNVQEQLSYSFEFWEEKSDQTVSPDSAAIEEISPAESAADSVDEESATESFAAAAEAIEVIEIQKKPVGDRAADRPKKALISNASRKPSKKKPKPALRAKTTGGKAAKKPVPKPVGKKARAVAKAGKAAAGGKAAKSLKPARAVAKGKAKAVRKPVKKAKAVKRVVKSAVAKAAKRPAKSKAKKATPAKKGRAKSR